MKKFIKCEFKISSKCIDKEIDVGAIKENKKRNGGKYRCKFCAIHNTHLGENSHFYKYTKNSSFFSNIDNEIKSYLLGIIAGDGHISKSSNLISVVSNEQDVEILNLFKKFICDKNLLKKKNSNCFEYSINNIEIKNDLLNHLNIKAGKKSDKITLPTLNNNLMLHFLRGLFDTDGCINSCKGKVKHVRCFFSSTSNKILNEIQYFFESNYKITSKFDKIKLVFNGAQAIKLMELLYNNSNYYLNRKNKRYLEWKEFNLNKKDKRFKNKI